MASLVFALYAGLFIFALNGMVMLAMIRKIDQFDKRAKWLQARLLNFRNRPRR